MYGLAAALQQLTQLTTLHLNFGTFECGFGDEEMAKVDVNHLFQALPSSLAVLNMGCRYSDPRGSRPNLHTTSLRHLVSLQHLTLPHVVVTSSGDAGADLAPLTALTYLEKTRALEPAGRALLAAPNLVSVDAGWCGAAGLQDLAGSRTLRSLFCAMGPRVTDAEAAALAQLTQLTHLGFLVDDGDRRMPPADTLTWLTALSSLTGLRSLKVEPEVLDQLDLRPLTALTKLAIDMYWSQYSQEELRDRVCRLHAAPRLITVWNRHVCRGGAAPL